MTGLVHFHSTLQLSGVDDRDKPVPDLLEDL